MLEMLKMRAVVSEKRTEQQKQSAEVASRESSSYETKQPPEHYAPAAAFLMREQHSTCLPNRPQTRT
jgi:hypothetical protein